MKLRFFFLSQ